ncbi:ABC transporter substrate-binding protein, partial [Pseudomonas coronafaciens]
WGTTGIGYDVDKVKAAIGDDAPVDSWDLVFKEENISKLKQCGVAMLDSPSEIISIALHYLGLPHNSKNPEDYKKAQALLLKIRPYVRYFDSSKIDADLADGNICVVVGWANGALAAQEINEKNKTGRRIAYSIPREGALVWSENMVLLKDAPHPQEGMKFINYMLRPEVIAKTSNHTLYPSANKAALQFVDAKLSSNTSIYLDKYAIARLFPLEPLPLKLERIRTRAWVKIKSGM